MDGRGSLSQPAIVSVPACLALRPLGSAHVSGIKPTAASLGVHDAAPPGANQGTVPCLGCGVSVREESHCSAPSWFDLLISWTLTATPPVVKKKLLTY